MKSNPYFAWLSNRNARRAFVFACGWHAFAALLVALPVASVIRSATSALPDLEHSLLAPGCYLLSEVLRLEKTSLSAAAEITISGVVVAAVSRLVPLTGLVVALRSTRPFSSAAWARRILLALATQTKLAAFNAIALLIGGGAGLLGTSAVLNLVSFGQDDPTRDVTHLGLICLFLAPSIVFQPLTDLARFSERPNARGLGSQLVSALEIFSRAPSRILGAYLVPQIIGYGCAFAAAAVAYNVELGGPGRIRELCGALVHLVGLTLLLASRVCWLSRAEHSARQFRVPLRAEAAG